MRIYAEYARQLLIPAVIESLLVSVYSRRLLDSVYFHLLLLDVKLFG